jgi:hypothetical protein
MSVVRPERANFDDLSIGEPLDGRIILCLHVALAAAQLPARCALREIERHFSVCA